MPHSLLTFTSFALAIPLALYFTRQCRKPSGWVGRFIVWTMNRSHSGLTSWGLKHVQIGPRDSILDVGCGGGRTIQRLAAIAHLGKVCGVDYAETSVAASRALNKTAVESGQVEIQKASVSRLPFPNDSFDLVTAVETHYYWPDRLEDLREICRVLKPGGTVLLIAEAYRGSRFDRFFQAAMKLIGGTQLSPDEHRDWFAKAGCIDIEVAVEPAKGWICATGRKP